MDDIEELRMIMSAYKANSKVVGALMNRTQRTIHSYRNGERKIPKWFIGELERKLEEWKVERDNRHLWM